MQFRHLCGMQSFVSGPLFISICLFYSRHTKLPGRKCARPRRRRRPRPASGATCAGHGHVPGGSAPVLAAMAAGRGRHRSQPPAQAAAAGTGHGQRSLSSLLFAVVAVPALAVVAVPAGGARRGHVPRARRRRCCGPLLRRGRPRRWRPPRPRLRRHCRRRNSTAGNLPKAYQIMRNDATWKMNRYLCSVKIHVTMGVS